MELRPAIQRFAEAMETRLQGQPERIGWLQPGVENCKLADAMTVHAHEVLRASWGECLPEDNHELDAANYLMMIFDRNQPYPIGD